MCFFLVLVVAFSFTTNSSPSRLFLAPLTLFIHWPFSQNCSILAFLENALWVPPTLNPPQLPIWIESLLFMMSITICDYYSYLYFFINFCSLQNPWLFLVSCLPHFYIYLLFAYIHFILFSWSLVYIELGFGIVARVHFVFGL